MFCRECGKEIEEGDRFCRFCGKPQQASGPANPETQEQPPTLPRRKARPAIEQRLRQLFPRHHLQDDFSHIATIAAVVIAVVGFLVGLFPGLGGQVYGLTWLLFAIFVVLFLMLRESTLSHSRGTGPTDPASDGNGPPARYHAARTPETSKQEGATAVSSNPRPTP